MKHRENFSTNIAASGIYEEVKEAEIIFDDLILYIDESDEQMRAEADNLKRSEEELLESGNNIRNTEFIRS